MNGKTEGFEHAMRREIYEQPAALDRTLAEYLDSAGGLNRERFEPALRLLRGRGDLVIAASGSSRHAGLTGEIMLEDTAGMVVDVEYASEYITRSTQTRRGPSVLVLSQSGETADTLAALDEARARGLPTLAITNVPGSTMAREADVSLPTYAGVEHAIPATKSFTTQLLVLRLLSLALAKEREQIGRAELAGQLAECRALPEELERQLVRWDAAAQQLAEQFASARTLLYLGRGIHYAVAREGALKLKESSYVHAEGYPAGELKHGPNALVSDEVPLMVLATSDPEHAESRLRYEKTLGLLRDLRVQNARLGVIGNAGDTRLQELATAYVPVAAAGEYLLPLLEVVPLQMFAYWMALAHGVDVDRPRNLVKAVVRE